MYDKWNDVLRIKECKCQELAYDVESLIIDSEMSDSAFIENSRKVGYGNSWIH